MKRRNFIKLSSAALVCPKIAKGNANTSPLPIPPFIRQLNHDTKNFTDIDWLINHALYSSWNELSMHWGGDIIYTRESSNRLLTRYYANNQLDSCVISLLLDSCVISLLNQMDISDRISLLLNNKHHSTHDNDSWLPPVDADWVFIPLSMLSNLPIKLHDRVRPLPLNGVAERGMIGNTRIFVFDQLLRPTTSPYAMHGKGKPFITKMNYGVKRAGYTHTHSNNQSTVEGVGLFTDLSTEYDDTKGKAHLTMFKKIGENIKI